MTVNLTDFLYATMSKVTVNDTQIYVVFFLNLKHKT
jgi:hypothetical protein